MSILYRLLPFLCLSLHGCNARPLDAAIDKNDEKIKGIDTLLPIPASPKSPLSNDQVRASTREITVTETSLIDKQKKSNEKNASSDQTEPLVSVSCQVPRNKHALKLPGFNSDYSQPKTHPPSHN